MFRGIRHSAAWLGCAAGLLLHVGTVHANARPPAPQVAPTPLAVAPSSAVLRVLALPITRGAADTADRDEAERMLEDFARVLGRRLEWNRATKPAELLNALREGTTDIVVGATPDDLEPHLAAATAPVATEHYVVVGRPDNPARNPLELAQMNAVMAAGSPHWDYFQRVQAVVPGLKVNAVSDALPPDAPLQLVADGMVDVAIVPVIDGLDRIAEHPRLQSLFNLTDERAIRWHVRRDDPSLLASLDQFIARYHAAYFEPPATLRDFDAIKRRGVLRVITRVESGNYFIRDGRPSGFELEMASNFAKRHGLRLEVRVADSDERILEWLAKGTGDLVTARIGVDRDTLAAGLSRSRRYHYEAYATVSRRDLPLRSPEDLAGLVFAATEHSPEYRALATMRAQQPGLSVIAASPELAESELFARVAEGMVDATIVPGRDAARIRAEHPELTVGTSIGHAYDYRWTVRDGDQALLEAVDDFLVDAQSSGLTTMLAARYEAAQAAPTLLANDGGRLSPYDPIVQRYADRYGFDWRLIAAQMYQESQFDPRAVSRSGARGLMQLMPSTAQSLGFADLARPDAAIHAGVKYLYELRNDFDAEVPAGERTWFALAAYNLGPQRVERARRLAERLKLDPNRWAGNVETAMLKLARPEHGGLDRRYGQAIIYVRAIQSLYGSYRSLQVSSAPGLTPVVPRA